MNVDTTDNSTATFEFTVGGDPPTNNVSITGPKRCESPFCSNLAAIGSKFCRTCGTSPLDDTPTNDDPILGSRTSGPSNRDIQRQLDRLEGKLDALIAALTDTEDDNE